VPRIAPVTRSITGTQAGSRLRPGSPRSPGRSPAPRAAAAAPRGPRSPGRSPAQAAGCVRDPHGHQVDQLHPGRRQPCPGALWSPGRSAAPRPPQLRPGAHGHQGDHRLPGSPAAPRGPLITRTITGPGWQLLRPGALWSPGRSPAARAEAASPRIAPVTRPITGTRTKTIN
jgi:hypothetical protein